MGNIWQQLLKRFFAVREGELLRTLLMQLLIFLLITTLLIVKSTVNGLFLSELGVDYLPLAFVLVAISAVLVSGLYAAILKRSSLDQLILGTLLFSGLLFVVFGLLLRLNLGVGWVLYFFYVTVALFGVLSASQFWILANMVFNARAAKRLFGIIGTGAIAGGITGGYLTSILAEPLGSENMLFVGAGLLFCCIPITRYIWKTNVLGSQSRFQRRKKVVITDQPLAIIRKSVHLSNLAGIIGLSVVVAKLVDYQFSAIAAAHIADPDELTAFLGFWYSNFNLFSLVVQLVFTRLVLGTLGVGSSLLFLPMSIFLGAVGIFFAPELWVGVFIKASDGSLKQSLNKAGVELLALPIPAEIKNATKTFIDVVVDSLATGVSGLILVFVVNGFHLSVEFVSVIIILLVGLWLYLIEKVRISYLDAFKQGLHKNNSADTDALELGNMSVLGNLQQVLAEGSEVQILYVLNKLKQQPDERLLPAIQPLLQHPSARVLVGAIRNLYYLKNKDLSELIAPLTRHADQEVKTAAFDYLLNHSPKKGIAYLHKGLEATDHKRRAAALVSLAAESRDNPALKVTFRLEQQLQQQYAFLATVSDSSEREVLTKALLKALGLARIPAYFPWISACFSHPDKALAGEAILAAGQTMHPHFIPFLIGFLGDPDLGDFAAQALVNYGTEIVGILQAQVNARAVDAKVVRKIPQIVGQFNSQKAVDLLFTLLSSRDPTIRLNALRALNTLKTQHNFLTFKDKKVWQYVLDEVHLYQDILSILYVQQQTSEQEAGSQAIRLARQQLITLLESRLDVSLECIFRLLGLKYPPEEIISIYESLRSEEPDLRENALEYLDNLLDAGSKKVLIPIVEITVLESITAAAIRELKLELPNEAESFRLLMAAGDEEIAQAVRELQGLL
ncbi:MAG: hypothetical protein DA408_06150 [Bacteroidetes bacterium]|nr:MAG: hypothetical protein DA408_06150 [Bacteroidota bacterium]